MASLSWLTTPQEPGEDFGISFTCDLERTGFESLNECARGMQE